MAGVLERRERHFEDVDAMPHYLRACVHEYGYAVVSVLRKYGITNPAHIHDIVREVWEGARDHRQKRSPTGTLDWLLIQAGAQINSRELRRVLRNNNLVLLPVNPTSAMIDASMQAVSGHNVLCTKREKHLRRLQAAMNAGDGWLDM